MRSIVLCKYQHPEDWQWKYDPPGNTVVVWCLQLGCPIVPSLAPLRLLCSDLNSELHLSMVLCNSVLYTTCIGGSGGWCLNILHEAGLQNILPKPIIEGSMTKLLDELECKIVIMASRVEPKVSKWWSEPSKKDLHAALNSKFYPCKTLLCCSLSYYISPLPSLIFRSLFARLRLSPAPLLLLQQNWAKEQSSILKFYIRHHISY